MKLENDKQVFCTFTSANIYLLVNDHLLGGVNTVTVKDFKEPTGPYTRISMDRVVFDGTQDTVELMRTQRFSFKLMNNTTQSGWVALDAELESYEMSLSTESGILYQHLVIRTSSFIYSENISEEHIAAKEEEDLKNLIEILKKNQTAAKKPEGFIKYGVPPAAVLPTQSEDILNGKLKDALKKMSDYAQLFEDKRPEVQVDDEDVIWLNAKDSEQIKDVKPRKLKKKNKK